MIDRRTVLAAGALPLAGCASRLLRPQGAEIRVATLNIWHNAGDWTARRPLLIEALRGADADAILLQEVLQDLDKGLPNQADMLAEALGGYSVRFMSTTPEGERKRFGNAVLSRSPVIDAATRRLEPLNDHRTALRVRVRRDGRPVDLVCTHLAWQADAGPVRARQIADLVGWLPRDGVPLIIGGDFNAPLTEASLQPLRARDLESALPPGAAATTLNPAKGHGARVIDHILFERDAFTVADARLFADQPTGGEYPSDHFGVVATLRLR